MAQGEHSDHPLAVRYPGAGELSVNDRCWPEAALGVPGLVSIGLPYVLFLRAKNLITYWALLPGGIFAGPLFVILEAVLVSGGRPGAAGQPPGTFALQ